MESLKIRNLLLLLLATLITLACEKNNLANSLDELGQESLVEETALGQELIESARSINRESREIPFRARFATRLTPDRFGEVTCDDPTLPFPNFQSGFGKATHLGGFTTELTFCSGGAGVYGGASGYLEAANGDRLFICIESGQVILPLPEPHPVYDAFFKDPFTFCGGTGRFEGASGGGMTNSLVDLWNEDYPFPGPIIPNHRTDHEWTGTLILPNGHSSIR